MPSAPLPQYGKAALYICVCILITLIAEEGGFVHIDHDHCAMVAAFHGKVFGHGGIEEIQFERLPLLLDR